MKPRFLNPTNLTPAQERFVVERLRREWLEAEMAAKKRELVKKAEAAGVALGKTLLALLLTTGFLTVVAIAPNAFAAFGKAGMFRRHFKTRRNLQKELNYGSSQSYWCYRRIREGKYQLKLTPKGKRIALWTALKNMRLGREKKWDGVWRVVVFDIPRKRNAERAFFRQKLKDMGMVRIQDSVFVYPYPCVEEVMFWASLLNVVHDIQIMESKFLTDLDAFLKREFSLL